MSYVLEAQRKRHQQSTPELAAQYAMADAKRRRLLLFGNVIAVIVIVILATLLWLTNTGDNAPANDAPIQPQPQQIAPQPAPRAQPEVEQAPAQPATVEQPVEQPSQTAATPTPRNVQPDPPQQVRAPASEKPLIQLHEASPATQDALLGFSYSSHIYGDDEDGRMIFVDGRKLIAGETHNGWMLRDITEDGVVWENADERVHVSVLDLWQ